MRINSLQVEAYRLPPSSPWEDATNKVANLEFVIVTLTTDAGLKGTGFTYTVDIGGSAVKALIEDYLAPLVLGLDPENFEAIWAIMSRQSRRLGMGVNSMAIAAIDIAVWDLLGKIHQRPLHTLLGGARPSIAAYVSEIRLGADDTVDDLLERVQSYREAGYSTVKMKIGRADFAEDVERMSRASDALGPDGTLLVDLNQKWTLAQAIKNAAELDALRLGWVEEPLLYHDVSGYAELRRVMRTPIACGESLFGKEQVLQYLRADAIDVVQADVAFVGGITEWRRIAHLAEGFGKPVAPHFMMELSIQVLCGVPNAFMLENVVGGSFAELGIAESSVDIRNGVAYPSLRPGHGVVFDAVALAKHVLDPRVIRTTFAGGSK